MDEKYLINISQCLAFEAFNNLTKNSTDSKYKRQIISEFKKNPSKFKTLEEFLDRLNELEVISQSERYSKD